MNFMYGFTREHLIFCPRLFSREFFLFLSRICVGNYRNAILMHFTLERGIDKNLVLQYDDYYNLIITLTVHIIYIPMD